MKHSKLSKALKYTLLASCIFCLYPQIHAEDIVTSIEKQGNISVSQPQGLSELIKKAEAPATQTEESANTSEHSTTVLPTQPARRTGFRVQVFDDNNPRTARRQAEWLHQQVQNSLPHYRAYVTFNSPYWRVKVGDFRTRNEAQTALAELKRTFPSQASYMRIVRDKINLSE